MHFDYSQYKQKGFAPILIFLLIAVALAGFFVYQTRTNPVPLSQRTSQPTSVPSSNPIIDTANWKSSGDVTKEILIREMEVGSRVESLVQSPTDANLITYSAIINNYTGYGIYLYDKSTKKSKNIYMFDKPLFGRGGSYFDNPDMQFSPSGKAFFVNRPGTNTPTFFVFEANGKELYRSNTDEGHATWIDGNRFVYIISLNKAPILFNINDKSSISTNLPANIHHLKANSAGTVILALSGNIPADSCGNLDLYIYSFPAGKLINSVKSVYYSTFKWKTNTSFIYQKVTSCRQTTGFPEPILSDYQEITIVP